MSSTEERNKLLEEVREREEAIKVLEKAWKLLKGHWCAYDAGAPADEYFPASYCALSALNVASGFNHDDDTHGTQAEQFLLSTINQGEEEDESFESIPDWNDEAESELVVRKMFRKTINRLKAKQPQYHIFKAFLTAEQLGIEEIDRTALIKVLDGLESGFIDDEHFNMRFTWCSSAGCLLGWAREFEPACFHVAGFNTEDRHLAVRVSLLPEELRKLFWYLPPNHCSDAYPLYGITKEQGAQVLREYLLTGKETWAEVLKKG